MRVSQTSRHVAQGEAPDRWPPPAGRPVMTQTWQDLLFAHWPLPADEVRRELPPALELDTFDGKAWLGVIPFRMSGVRLYGLPALPGVSAFPELNVRTYVMLHNRPGVWFFSLDAASRLAVEVARRWYRLPYFRASMSLRQQGGWIEYTSRRAHRRARRAELKVRYRPTGEPAAAEHGTLDYFLTERYCLYATDRRGRIYRAEIHHPPWLLQPAEAEFSVNTMAQASGFELPDLAPILQFARRQDVVVWPPRRVDD